MIKKIILLSSACAITSISSFTILADSQKPAFEIQKTNLSHNIESSLVGVDGTAECIAINERSTKGGSVGEICLISGEHAISTSLSDAFLPQSSKLVALPDVELSSGPKAECISAGGSSESSGSNIGFCMAGDLSTSDEDIQHFSFKNGLPATGMQFLQAIFADGSTHTASTPIAQECLLPDGSPATIKGESSGGFCMISRLKRSIAEITTFSMANELPVVSLQFIQVTFKGNTEGNESTVSSYAECQSISGSAAQTSGKGGFCLASDLIGSSAEKSANFSIAHNLPVTDLVYLQLSFSDVNEADGQLFPSGLGAPIGAECISVEGSIGAGGNPEGFCLVSDLITSAENSANISIANDLSISALQFFQASFGEDNNGNQTPPTSELRVECASMNGSLAATEKTDGFCLVSDLVTASGSTIFTVANDLPVTSWEFIQIPSKDAEPIIGSNSPSGEVPEGIVVSNFTPLPFNLPAQDSLVDIIDPLTQYFHISNQTMGMELHSTLFWRDYPNLALWLGR